SRIPFNPRSLRCLRNKDGQQAFALLLLQQLLFLQTRNHVCPAIQRRVRTNLRELGCINLCAPCRARRRRRTRWGSRESQLLPRFLEYLLCFGEFVLELIG